MTDMPKRIMAWRDTECEDCVQGEWAHEGAVTASFIDEEDMRDLGATEYIRADAIDTEALAGRMARQLRSNGDIDDDPESEAGCIYELKAILDTALGKGVGDEQG